MAFNLDFMNEEGIEKIKKKLWIEEWNEFYGELSEALDTLQYERYHQCRAHSLNPKGK